MASQQQSLWSPQHTAADQSVGQSLGSTRLSSHSIMRGGGRGQPTGHSSDTQIKASDGHVFSHNLCHHFQPLCCASSCDGYTVRTPSPLNTIQQMRPSKHDHEIGSTTPPPCARAPQPDPRHIPPIGGFLCPQAACTAKWPNPQALFEGLVSLRNS